MNGSPLVLRREICRRSISILRSFCEHFFAHETASLE